MKMMGTKRKELYEKYNIIYEEIIGITNRTKEVHGDLNDLPYQGLYSYLLGTDEKIKNFVHMFENQDEPQTWKQGNLTLLGFKQKYSQKIVEEYKILD